MMSALFWKISAVFTVPENSSEFTYTPRRGGLLRENASNGPPWDFLPGLPALWMHSMRGTIPTPNFECVSEQRSSHPTTWKAHSRVSYWGYTPGLRARGDDLDLVCGAWEEMQKRKSLRSEFAANSSFLVNWTHSFLWSSTTSEW